MRLEVRERRTKTEKLSQTKWIYFTVSTRCFDNATVGDLFYICEFCLSPAHPIKNDRCNYWWIYMCWLLVDYKYSYCLNDFFMIAPIYGLWIYLLWLFYYIFSVWLLLVLSQYMWQGIPGILLNFFINSVQKYWGSLLQGKCYISPSLFEQDFFGLCFILSS